MKPFNTRKPCPSANRDTAQNQKQPGHITTVVREIIAVLTVGAMMATMFWTSVFGMTGNFGPGPEITVNERLAAGGIDGQ